MNVEDSLKPRYVVTPGTLAAVQNPLNRNPNDVKKFDKDDIKAKKAKYTALKSASGATQAEKDAATAKETALQGILDATPEAYDPAAFAKP